MCDPVTAMMAIGTGLSAVGSIQKGQAAKQADDYNAQVQDENAKQSLVEARSVIAQGRQQIDVMQDKDAQIQGADRAAFAANGVDAGFGSPLDVLIGNATKMQKDIKTATTNIGSKVSDLSYQSISQNNQASLDRSAGQGAATAGWLNAGGDILSGGAKTYSYGKTNGVF